MSATAFQKKRRELEALHPKEKVKEEHQEMPKEEEHQETVVKAKK